MFADTRPLTVPAFRRLWVANIVTMIGAQLTVVAVPAQIFELTQSSAYVGLTGLFGVVPLVIFGLYGGTLSDAVNQRTLLLVATFGLVVTSALFFVQASLGIGNVWLILCLFSVQQAFFGISQPTRRTLIPRLMPAELLPAANSLDMTLLQAGAIAGPLVGGALIPVFGLSTLYLLDTIGLLATVGAAWALPQLPPRHNAPAAGLRSVLEGFSYLRTQPVVLMSFVVDVIAMVFGMPRALYPEMAHADFGGALHGGAAFAILFAGIPAGAVVGGIFSGWVSMIRRQGVAVLACIAVWGLSIVGFGLAAGRGGGQMSGWFWIAVAGLLIGGAADMASAAFRISILQTAATEEIRGRMQGVFIVVVVGGPRIADVLHGAGAAEWGTTATAAGGGALVVVLVGLCAVVARGFRNYAV